MLDPAASDATGLQDRAFSSRRRLQVGGLAFALGGVMLAGFGLANVGNISEHALADAWHRSVEADASFVQTIGDIDRGHGAIQPASTSEGFRPPLVGERVTVVAPDGSIRSLRVCDPASPAATTAPDCLNAYVARAVNPTIALTPQRSL